MNVKNISFGGLYNTREVANIVTGKEVASSKFLSSITGIPVHNLLTNNSSDMFVAGSAYCAEKIAKDNPEFAGLREIALQIKKSAGNIFSKKPNIDNFKELLSLRDKKIEEFCKSHGKKIEIEEFSVPFLKG